MPWDRHIYWEERERRERESIEKSLRHEDIIYFTFLLSLLGIILTSIYLFIPEFQKLEFRGTKFAVFAIISLIIFFAILRFIGVILESVLLRYFSLHGLFYSLIIFVLFRISAYIIIIFLFVIFIFGKKISIYISNKILRHLKYRSLKEKYKKDIYNLPIEFYQALLFLAAIPLLYYLSFYDPLPLIRDFSYRGKACFFIILSIVFLCYAYVKIYKFNIIKNKGTFNMKEDTIKYFKSSIRFLFHPPKVEG
ncbi:MAG TPA: hypothetical protein ENI52_05505 [Thermoplasmata archaeon]|nr:hypothetical protein [Thermoplasmata archaeon]